MVNDFNILMMVLIVVGLGVTYAISLLKKPLDLIGWTIAKEEIN